jgi:hypothetical protein
LGLGSPVRNKRACKAQALEPSPQNDHHRPQTDDLLYAAGTLVDRFIYRHNHQRLHSAFGYITPVDVLAGHDEDAKLEEARTGTYVCEHTSAMDQRQNGGYRLIH